MMKLVLLGLVVLAVGGCVCVVWADRGGPRWTRVVAAATLCLGRLVRSSAKNNRRSGGSSGGD
ncbi:hypothetical protein [Streptomyces sp. NPDC048442]|uniref:hypothetical protein n=1 Tax=Streptomyces sp. NPDC048442 TaxID=3154823 RepID=UPI00341436AF